MIDAPIVIGCLSYFMQNKDILGRIIALLEEVDLTEEQQQEFARLKELVTFCNFYEGDFDNFNFD